MTPPRGDWNLSASQQQALDAYVLAGSEPGAAKRLRTDVRQIERLLDDARWAMGAPHRVAMVVEWTIYRTGEV
jgi:hypothetical protein